MISVIDIYTILPVAVLSYVVINNKWKKANLRKRPS